MYGTGGTAERVTDPDRHDRRLSVTVPGDGELGRVLRA